MAEGRRREDEEEELRERRELAGPRRARGRALSGHSAAGEGRARGRGSEGWAPGPAHRWRLLHPPRRDGRLTEREGQWPFHLHFRAEPEEIRTGLYLPVALEPKLHISLPIKSMSDLELGAG